ALLALIAIFLPGMLLLLAALPFWSAISGNRTARAAIAGANAAVVGILAAALWNPVITSGITGIAPLTIALVCALMLLVWKLPAWLVVIVGAVLGIFAALVGL